MRQGWFWFSIVLFCSTAAGVGCSGAAGEDDGGSSSSSGAASQDGGSSGAVQQGDVTVVLDGKELPVSFEGLTTTTFKDQEVIALPTVWAAAVPDQGYEDFVFNFVGADGFRPESRSKCEGVVFDGEVFAKGYIDVVSHLLVWEDSLGYSGCAFVKDLVTIEAKRP